MDIVAERPGKFQRIYLVGSYAKGMPDKESDIDLLVYPTAEAALTDLGHLQYLMQERSQKEVDIIDGTSSSKRFLDSVKKGEVLLYER